MAPKTGTSTSSPSALVADAISALQKTIGTALASAEEQGRADLIRVNTEIAALKRERDEATKLLNKTRADMKEWERREESWKSSIDKAELTIRHQAETIVQLREEALQWKNQLLRFEETSRREIQDWKDQYARAEQERLRLSARLDQLIAEQLESRPLNAQHDSLVYGPQKSSKSVSKQPRQSTSNAVGQARRLKPTSGSATDRERTYVDGMPRPDTPKGTSASSLRTPKQAGRAAVGANATPRASSSRLEPEPSPMPPSKLIRRVHAVIEVPVKEEEYSDQELPKAERYDESSGSESEYVPEKPARTSAAKPRRRSSMATTKGKQKTQQRRYVEPDESCEEDESEEDQLLIGSDDDANDKVVPTNTAKPGSKHPRPSVGRAQPPGNVKRRKLNQDVATGAKVQNKSSR